MKTQRLFIALAIVLASLCTGFAEAKKAPEPQLSSLQIQAIQAREFETSKSTAFASVLSVFQDLGYIVESAAVDTGFITAKSAAIENSRAEQFWLGRYVNKDTKVTAFIEELKPGTTKIRLNFVNTEAIQMSGSNYSGLKRTKDTVVYDPAIYQNAFTKIQEAIFIRSASK